MAETTTAKERSPYESATELQRAHARLLEKLDGLLSPDEGAGADETAVIKLEPEIEEFLERGVATGIFLDQVKTRTACQVLLDYWVSSLTGAGRDVRRFRLQPFDAERLPDLEDKPCPYVGLDAFRNQDQKYFFGREADTKTLLDQIHESGLVVVIGASGSGKSSLVMGGVLPALSSDESAHGWRIAEPFVPGDVLLDSFARSLLTVVNDGQTDIRTIAAGLRANPEYLADLLGRSNGRPVLITIDQFEEVFTLSEPRDRDVLIANLATLLRLRSMDRVILTVREEFRSRIVELRELEPFLDQAWYSMRPMGYNQLQAAVEKPAAAVNLQFQAGIVDDLVKRVLGQPAALPLLQFTLRKLWHKRDRNRITWEVYGEVGDPLSALEASANGFYGGLAQQNSDEVKRILLALVRVDELLEAYRQPLRKRELLKAGRANTERVLQLLEDNDYVRVTPGENEADAVVEIKHEALIRNWGKLGGWIEEKRLGRRQRLALVQAAARWAEAGKPVEGLLSGWQLEEAKRRADLSPLELEFIEASATEVEREQHEREAALRREADQAHELASKERSLRKAMTGLLVAVAIIAVVVGGLLWQTRTAGLQTQRAEVAETWKEEQQQRTAGELERKAGELTKALGFKEDCEQGDIQSCRLLGSRYELGRGVDRDETQAAKLYKDACDVKDAESCMFLGKLYEEGRGVTKNETRAAALYRRTRSLSQRACQEGKAEGCRLLGKLFATGRGVTNDDERAARLYERACDGGNADGCGLLGKFYARGRGVDPDPVRAAELYQQACDGGSQAGCTSLGVFYYRGDGVMRDEARAAELYEQGCNGGNARGCNNLGYLYMSGRGVAQDHVRAAGLFEKACDGGNPRGCRNLGSAYEDGRGVAKDDVRAGVFYWKSCDGGYMPGCDSLGSLFETGRGVTKDEVRAATLYQQACDGGHAAACSHLGVLYEEGRGVRQD